MKKKLTFILLQLIVLNINASASFFATKARSLCSYLAKAGSNSVQLAKAHPKWATYIGAAAATTVGLAGLWWGAHKDWHRLEGVCKEIEKQKETKNYAELTGTGSKYKQFIQGFNEKRLKSYGFKSPTAYEQNFGDRNFNYNNYVEKTYDDVVNGQSPDLINVSASEKDDNYDKNPTKADIVKQAGQKVIAKTKTLQTIVVDYKNKQKSLTFMTPIIAFLIPACLYGMSWSFSWLKSRII